MIAEEKVVLFTFEAVKGNFDVLLQLLSSVEGKILDIVLTDHASLDTFERVIDIGFMRDSPEMSVIF